MYAVRKMRGTASCSRKPQSRHVGERQVNVRVVPTGKAIEESVELISRTRVPASIAPELVADIFIRSCSEPFGACKASSIEVTPNLN
jgi:hypothetical protein